eukprot:TRINITY_DN7654_c0_g1_i32.p4 TRINITY_DN7654_c0_g1~~TRINITY_DN7654_c0_g1_i32.p4  ORF type:complete len:101 (-),score=38.18 TRINITY_DN7654_c0_g1_i32:880-1182(-)
MSLQQALIDLYIVLKGRAKMETQTSRAESERRNLLSMNPLTILEYIKSYIDIVVNRQVEEAVKTMEEEKQDESSQNLEQLTQSLEAEIRLYVRVRTRATA